MGKFTRLSKTFFKKKGSLLLSCSAAVGVIGTAVMAARATPKVICLLEEVKQEKGEELSKWETAQVIVPAYIPSVLFGTATIACIFGAHILDKRTQAALASAYALLDQSYKKYKKKVIELYGEDANTRIFTEIAKEEYTDEIREDEDDGKKLFFDTWSNRYFRATEKDILNIKLEMNRKLNREQAVCLNEYYLLLDLAPIDGGTEIGWDACQMFDTYWENWFDLIEEPVTLDDGLECRLLTFCFEPLLFDEEAYGSITAMDMKKYAN